jgi:lipopolysaccharide export system permease protein
MTLHLYFARRFFGLFMAVFGVFALFQYLLDLIEELRRAEAGTPFTLIAEITALKLPSGLYQILPLVLILATIGLFLNMARSSELVVARSAGRSGLTVLAAPLTVAALIGGLSVAMLNPIVAATGQRYSDLREAVRGDDASVISVGRDGLWLRQGSETGQAVIRAARASPDATVLYDVTILTYAPGAGPQNRIAAERAELVQGAWLLTDAQVWPLTPGLNPELGTKRHDSLRVASTLTSDSIRDRFGDPSDVAIWDLPAFISDLEEAGFSARRHIVWLQMEIARPLFLVSMVLLGAAFTMRPQRGGKTGLAVLASLLLGFGLFYIRNFAQILGEDGQIAPWMAAWVPPVASLMIAFGILLHMEDG